MSVFIASDEGFDLILFPLFGLALGLTFGSMSNTIPLMYAVLGWLIFVFAIWRGMSVLSFSMYGMTLGAIIGAMANIVPYSFVVLSYEGIFLTLMIKPNQEIKPTTWIVTPLILTVIGGLAFAPYNQDFINLNAQVNGFSDNWQGCQTSCFPGPANLIISLFTLGIFSPLLSGDIVGFFTGIFQSGASGIFGFLAIIAGVILTFLSLGIGGGFQAVASGLNFTVNEQGTRLAQSMAITFLAFGLVNLYFGRWFSILGGGWFGLETVLPVVYATITFYGGYLQGKTIT